MIKHLKYLLENYAFLSLNKGDCMKYFVLLVLFGVSICFCAEECLDYDDKSSSSYFRSKRFSEDMVFARTTMSRTMREYGFSICLEYFDLDSKRKEREMEYFQKELRLIEDRDWMKDKRCIITERGKKMKEEVETYVIDYKRKSIERIKSVLTEAQFKELLETPPLLAKCLSLYDSKEYQAEVERIVKKYCKDCK